jgi:hypothetical protein
MTSLGVDFKTSSWLSKDKSSSPNEDLKWDFGSSDKRWRNIYCNNIHGNLVGGSSTAGSWNTPITITLSGDASGSVSFDGSANATLNVAIANDSHNHTTTSITNFTQDVQTTCGQMIGTLSGISVSYDNILNKINYSVSPLTFSGDISASIVGTNYTITVLDDSHLHNSSYYTKTQSDTAYYPKSGGTIAGDVVISGNLTISGTTTTVNSNTVSIGDNIIVLNSDETGSPSQDGGIEIQRGTSSNVSFLWNESTLTWKLKYADGTPVLFGGVAAPIDGTHVGDRDYNDSRYINTTGDTLTGTLNARSIIPSASGYALGSSSIKWSNIWSNIVDISDDPTTGTQVGNRLYNDNRYVASNDTTIVRTNVASADTQQKWFQAVQISGSGAIDWNCNTEQVKILSLTGSSTVNAPTNMKAGGTYVLIIKYTGSYTITNWASAFKWVNGVKPVLTSTINATDIITFICDGTYMYGTEQSNFV